MSPVRRRPTYPATSGRCAHPTPARPRPPRRQRRTRYRPASATLTCSSSLSSRPPPFFFTAPPVRTLDRLECFGDIVVERPRLFRRLADPPLKREIGCCKSKLNQKSGPDVGIGVGSWAGGAELVRPLFVGGRVRGQLAKQVGRDQQSFPPFFGVGHPERTGPGDDGVDQRQVGRLGGGPLFEQADDGGAAVRSEE